MPRLGKGFITALDIGSSKTSCFIAEISTNNELNILGIGHQISQGVKAGTITDIKLAEQSVRAAVGAAEQMAGVNVDRVFVNISGCYQKSHNIRVEMALSANEINIRDIHKIIAQGCDQVTNEENEIIHCLPISYTIDGVKDIKDPIGMHGKVLSAEMHIITAAKSSLRNITACLAKCHLDVENYVSAPYASALACLNDDERSLGTILIDFGGGQTCIAIFKNGEMMFSDFVPVGGQHITSDIALGFATTIESSERVKTLYGSLISTAKDEREIIDIPQIGDDGHSEMSHIERANLVSIIKPRVDEIIEMVADKIDASGYIGIGGNIVITGGGSQLGGMKEAVSHCFSKRVRQGVPQKLEGMAESTKGPSFSTCTGVLLFALHKRAPNTLDLMGGSKFNSPVQRVISWLRENF